MRDESEVECVFGRHAGAAREFRRINFTNDVGKLRSRCEAFSIPFFARPPANRDLFRGSSSMQRLPWDVIGLYGSS